MDYLRVGLVIAPQFFAGCLIYLLLLKRTEVAAVELLSIGSVLGIVSCTIVDQIFVNIQMPRIGWFVAVLVATGAFLVVKQSKKIAIPTVLWKSEFTKSFLPITAISAMALGTEWFWLFPSGVLFVIASFISVATPQKYSRFAIRTASLGALITGVFMIASRPKIWWLVHDEFPFFQLISRSLADWGFQDYALQSGVAFKYHWFTYAWIGLVDRTSGASVFFVLAKVAPVIFALLITAVSWSFISSFSKSILRTYTGTLLVMSASTYPLWGYGLKITLLMSPSSFFTTAIFFVTVYFLVLGANQMLHLQLVTTSILVAITMLGKTMHGVVLISAIAFALVIEIFTKKKVDRKNAVSGCLAIAIGLSTYFLLISNPVGKDYYQINIGRYFPQAQSDAQFLLKKYVTLIGLLIILAIVVLPVLLILLKLLRFHTEKFYFIDLLSSGALISGASLAFLINTPGGGGLYFIQAATALSTLLSFSSLSRIDLTPIKIWTRLGISTLGVAFCALSFLIPSTDSGSPHAIIVRSMRIYASAVLLIVSVLVILAIGALQRRNSFNQVLKVTVVAAIMSVSFSAANWFNVIERKHKEFARDGETYLATDNLANLAKWVNSNSKSSDIVASNFGWPKLADNDIEFYRAPCTEFKNKGVLVETCRRTDNVLLVVYMHRRTWLQATKVHYTGFTPEIDSRQTATLGFASDPTAAQAKQMLDDGVDWFVVDRSTTNRTSWEPFATIRYSNDTFFVLELNKI